MSLMSALFERLLYLCCLVLMPKPPSPQMRKRSERPRSPEDFGR